MTSTSTQLIAGALRQPSAVDSLHWVLPEVPFRTAQDYAAIEYLYRLRLCSVQVCSSVLLEAVGVSAATKGYNLDTVAPISSAVVSSIILQYPMQVTAQLSYMDEPLSPVIESSVVYATAVDALAVASDHSSAESIVSGDAAHIQYTVAFVFTEEWMIFPLELCDIPLDATCELHLWYNDVHVAAATFHVYSVEGELLVGRQHLTLFIKQTASVGCRESPVAEAAALLDEYHRGRFPVIPWLDALSVRQLEARQALQARRTSTTRPAHTAEGNVEEGERVNKAALLTLYLPTATTAVFFEPAVASVAQDMLPLLMATDAEDATRNSAVDRTGNYTQHPFPDQYTFFKDYNLSEAKAAIMSKSQYFVSESSAPPGPKERRQLASLLRRPPIQFQHAGNGGGGGSGITGVGSSGLNRLEETRLLWKFRHFICKDGRFLLPFLRIVDWANTHSAERRAACALMQQWTRPGFADILACLSFYFDRVAPVRQYAVRLLQQESDARICEVAFQLLQAVRYDSVDGELAALLLDRAVGCWEVCSTFYTMLTVEVALERRRGGSHGKVTKGNNNGNGVDARVGSPAPSFTSVSPLPSPRPVTSNAVYEPLLRRLADRLTQHSPHFVARLRQQHALHRVLQQLNKQVQQSALDRLGKIALGNKLIAKQSCGMHTLFHTLSHRAPYKSSSLVIDAASAQQERSPIRSTSRADSGEERDGNESRETGEGGRERGTAEHGDHSNSPTTISPNAVTRTRAIGCARETEHTTHPAGGLTNPHRITTTTTTTTNVDILDRSGVATLPIYPATPIAGIFPDSLYIFKSAKLPLRLTFKALRFPAMHGAPVAATASSSSISANAPSAVSTLTCLPIPLAVQQQQRNSASWQHTAGTAAKNDSNSIRGVASVFMKDPIASVEEDTVSFPVMYKYNDDVRQDQLIVQFIRVMDDLLQQDGLQLYLTPYRVIATGPNEGLVEIVPQATTFLSVQREVLKYLRVYNPTAELLRQAMDRYTRSFAGYCVITFVLGIGDRHLENILLTQDGRLLHIDFGCVFGNDPKPFPPPMKINREMIEVLGGPQSTGFMEFKLYCCSAYNTLRKNASLLLHMLLLSTHAENMPQVTGEGGDPCANLLKVQEKLRLDLTNAQATQYLQNVIADSVGSIFTNLWDVLHAAAQATRS